MQQKLISQSNDNYKNKDLILRERLALQRTVLANQSTFLAFIRTTMYFIMAGLTIQNIFQRHIIIEVIFYITAAIIFTFGVINYIRHKNKIIESEVHVGNFKEEYINGK